MRFVLKQSRITLIMYESGGRVATAPSLFVPKWGSCLGRSLKAVEGGSPIRPPPSNSPPPPPANNRETSRPFRGVATPRFTDGSLIDVLTT